MNLFHFVNSGDLAGSVTLVNHVFDLSPDFSDDQRLSNEIFVANNNLFDGGHVIKGGGSSQNLALVGLEAVLVLGIESGLNILETLFFDDNIVIVISLLGISESFGSLVSFDGGNHPGVMFLEADDLSEGISSFLGKIGL